MVQPNFPVAESKLSVRSHYVGRVGGTVIRTSPFIPGQNRDPGLIDTAGNRTHGHRIEVCESAVLTIVL
jgi:hypothetical protein